MNTQPATRALNVDHKLRAHCIKLLNGPPLINLFSEHESARKCAQQNALPHIGGLSSQVVQTVSNIHQSLFGSQHTAFADDLNSQRRHSNVVRIELDRLR